MLANAASMSSGVLTWSTRRTKTQGVRRHEYLVGFAFRIGIGRVDEQHDGGPRGQQFVQHVHPLGPKRPLQRRGARDITARVALACDQAARDRVAADPKDDRNGLGSRLGRECGCRAHDDHENGHPSADQIAQQDRQSLVVQFDPAVLDRDVPSDHGADLA
jgi:hypothetical protein